MKLKAFEVLNDPKRSQVLDFYRGIAICAVVFFHFGPVLHYGYIGVDLFFVISGFLVGGILIEKYRKGKIGYWKFILQRGFKIWPSYFFFLFVGNFVAYLLYQEIKPEAYIEANDLWRYAFFYRNYTGVPHHWNFDHVWSLCIEEHFYILFPLALMVMMSFGNRSERKLYLVCIGAILMGFVFKLLSLNFTNGRDTYAATHNRIDALSYGALLYLVNSKFKERFIYREWFLITGTALLAFFIFADVYFQNYFYNKVVFHSILPLAFALMIFGSFHLNFKHFFTLRFIAYYSYNFYLWHPLLIFYIYHAIGINFMGFVVYLVASFLIAFFATILVEERFLTIRARLFNKNRG